LLVVVVAPMPPPPLLLELPHAAAAMATTIAMTAHRRFALKCPPQELPAGPGAVGLYIADNRRPMQDAEHMNLESAQ
jgi:kynureninase